jgi:hypothetical protein
MTAMYMCYVLTDGEGEEGRDMGLRILALGIELSISTISK